MRLLLAEDEPDFLATLTKVLRAQGYAVDEATDGAEALHKAQITEYDAIILDVMLPELDGFELLQELRRTHKTPVLMLTARGRTVDRVRGLDTGADDYMVKPVDLHELAARVRALIRRSAGEAGAPISVGDVTIDLALRRVFKAGEIVALSAREYSILEYLALHRGKIVTRSDLFEHLHDETEIPLSNLVDVHVFNLRKKLGADFITTYRGQGFSLEA
ncbi:response regulator transcription factor [soil metagenome]